MNSRFFWIAMALMPLRAIAYEEAPLAPPIVDTSTGPALTIDSWAPKTAPKPTPEALPVPEATPDVVGKMPAPAPAPAAASAPAPAVAAPSALPTAPAAPAAPPSRIAMNEMTGTISSIDDDAKTIRLSVEGGVTPQFDYDDQTVVRANGGQLKISNLQRDDQVIVRYVGKDLIAREIERVKKATP